MTIDKKIIKSFIEGDADAFDEIYRYYSKKMFHFALGLVKSEDIAKDMVQEVFINLWDKRSQVDINLNFDNYIFTITYNAIRKFFRQKSIEKKVLNKLLQYAPEIIENNESTLIYNDLLQLANRSIESLPPQQKLVYKLSKQEGLKLKEIAEKLNISDRTAETHLARAIKYLKEELTKNSLLALLFFYLFLK